MDYSPETSNPLIDLEDAQRLQNVVAVNQMLRQAGTDGLNIDRLMSYILTFALQQLHAEDGSLLVVNEEQQIEHAFLYNDTFDVTNSFLRQIVAEGLAGWVIRTRQSALVDNTQSEPRWLHYPEHITQTEPCSVICAPLIVSERTIGVITLHKRGAHQFKPDDLNQLVFVANECAIHVENARQFEASQKQLRVSDLLNEASRVINSSLDIDEIMHTLLAQMNGFLNAEAISIALVDKATKELVYQVAEGVGATEIVGLRLPANQGLSGWVMEHCEPALVQDAHGDPRFYTLGDQRTGYETRSMICAPMHFKGEALGTIQAINPIDGVFAQKDLEMLVNLANIASSAIANAQQYAQTQAAEARYISLFQDSVDLIVLTDLNGRIVEVNKRTVTTLDYSRDDLLGKPISMLHASLAVIPKLERISVNQATMFQSKLKTKDGTLVPSEVYVKRTADTENDLIQWMHHDVSKQVELAAMRDDMTAMLFHDLQSPLGNVIASLELVAYEIPSSLEGSALSEMLDIARRSSQRLQRLIRSLLDINQLEDGQPITEKTRVNPYKLIDEVYETERPGFEQRRVNFATNLPHDLSDLYVEEDMLRRVLINLVSNALKYSSESKKITVKVEQFDQEKMMMFSVIDQGPGVPEEYRQTIFEKGKRIDNGDPGSKGLGLGLAFCRLVINAHGGRIWVEDAPGGGALFSFTLPLPDKADKA